MADLLQIVQSGDQDGDTITWNDTSEYVVPAWNRTRILDREAARGIHPGDDGWLTYSRHVGPIYGAHVTDVDPHPMAALRRPRGGSARPRWG